MSHIVKFQFLISSVDQLLIISPGHCMPLNSYKLPTSSDLLLSNFSHKDIHACMHIQILPICGIIDMGHFKASYQSLLHY